MTLPDLAATWAQVALYVSIKGIVLLLLVGGLVLALRAASAATRHALWLVALAGVLMLPFLSPLVPAWHVDVLPALPVAPAPPAAPALWAEPLPIPAPAPLPPLVLVAPGGAGEAIVVPAPPAPHAATPALVAAVPAAGRAFWRDAGILTWLFMIWAFGVVLIAAWLLFARIQVARMVRQAVPVRDEAWLDLFDRLTRRMGVQRPVDLRWTAEQTVPLATGCFTPVVLLPAEAEGWDDDQREAVLLHELAHVARYDCLTQLVAQTACTLHWFNPLVWVAAQRMQAEREGACDDLVLNAGARASDYAGHLLELARTLHAPAWSAPATVAMARRSELEGRLLAILDPSRRRHALNRATGLCAALVVVCLSLPLAALRPADAPRPALASVLLIDDDPAFDLDFDYHFDFHEETDGNRARARTATASPRIDTLSVEMLIELRKYGVDASFIRAMREAGYGDLTVEELIDLRKYGVDAAFVRSMQEAGFARLPVDDLIDLRKYGADPRFIRSLREAGFTHLDVEALLHLSKYGVSQELINGLREAGYVNLSADEIGELAKYGVDPTYIRAMREAGYEKLSVEDLVDLNKYGVDPGLLRTLKELGYNRPGIEELTELAKHGVDAGYVREMNKVGYGRLSLNDLAELGKYGVHPDYVRSLSEAGLKKVTVDQLIDLAKHGVDADYIREMNKKH